MAKIIITVLVLVGTCSSLPILLPIKLIKCERHDVKLHPETVKRGVLHIHSFFSHDSKLSPWMAISFARKEKIDFIVFTDHGNNHVGRLVGKGQGVNVIAGKELRIEGKYVLLFDDIKILTHSSNFEDFDIYEGFTPMDFFKRMKTIALMPSLPVGWAIFGSEWLGMLYTFFIDEKRLRSGKIVVAGINYHLKGGRIPPISILSTFNVMVWGEKPLEGIKEGRVFIALFDANDARDFLFALNCDGEMLLPSSKTLTCTDAEVFLKVPKNGVGIIKTDLGEFCTNKLSISSGRISAKVLKPILKLGNLLVGAKLWIWSNPFLLQS